MTVISEAFVYHEFPGPLHTASGGRGHLRCSDATVKKPPLQQKNAFSTAPFVRFIRTSVQFRCEDVEGMASQNRGKRHVRKGVVAKGEVWSCSLFARESSSKGTINVGALRIRMGFWGTIL